MTNQLFVFVGDQLAATLSRAAGQLELRYTSSDAPSVSARLPPRDQTYGDDACRGFFSNLLPEGAWRDALCRQLGLSRDDDFGLLATIGADCAGAVALHEDETWRPERGSYRATTHEELRAWVKRPGVRPHIHSSRGLRLSLAGAQDKLLIHLDGNAAMLCDNGVSSTVILKPDIVDPFNEVSLSALNELFCMRLADHVGISVARTFWMAAAFAIERYDRVRDGTRWKRLHQEDFVQLLGRLPGAKYDVTWSECFEVVGRYVSTPARARVRLVDQLLFNIAIGNHDAHAKNFSVLHTPAGATVLTPVYDLLCTQMYGSLSPRFAMPIGGAQSLAELHLGAWRTFAADVGVTLPFVRQRARRIIDAITPGLAAVTRSLETSEPMLTNDIYPARRRHDVYGGITAVVADNTTALTRSLRE